MNDTIEYSIIVRIPKGIDGFQKILSLFLERVISIASINLSEMEVGSGHKLVVSAKMKKNQIIELVQLLKNQFNIDDVIFQEEQHTIYQELGVFKISSDYFLENNSIQHIIDKHFAKVIQVTTLFFVVEKIGRSDEILKFYNEIKPHGLLEFNRSGRVALTECS